MRKCCSSHRTALGAKSQNKHKHSYPCSLPPPPHPQILISILFSMGPENKQTCFLWNKSLLLCRRSQLHFMASKIPTTIKILLLPRYGPVVFSNSTHRIYISTSLPTLPCTSLFPSLSLLECFWMPFMLLSKHSHFTLPSNTAQMSALICATAPLACKVFSSPIILCVFSLRLSGVHGLFCVSHLPYSAAVPKSLLDSWQMCCWQARGRDQASPIHCHA